MQIVSGVTEISCERVREEVGHGDDAFNYINIFKITKSVDILIVTSSISVS